MRPNNHPSGKRLTNALFIISLGTIAVSLIFVICANAQPSPVKWGIKANQPVTMLKAGNKLTVQITAQIGEGWYIYSLSQPKGGPIATSISLTAGLGFRLAGRIRGPRPQIKFDSSFGINVETYNGTAVFSIPLQVANGSRAGGRKLRLNVRIQACNGEICLPPRTVKLEL